MRLSPGQDLAKALKGLQANEMVFLERGTYHGDVLLKGLRNVRIQSDGAVFAGGTVGLKLQDCQNVNLVGLTFQGAKQYGVMIQGCQHVTLTECKADRCGTTGMLTANSSHVTFDTCKSDNAATQHGYYCSQSGDDLAFINCSASSNFRSGIQINADEQPARSGDPLHDSISDGVSIQGCTLTGNQKAGAAAINIACAHNVRVVRNTIEQHRGRAFIALFADGRGPRFACKDVTIEGNTGSFAAGCGKCAVSIAEGSDVPNGSNAWPAHVLELERQ